MIPTGSKTLILPTHTYYRAYPRIFFAEKGLAPDGADAADMLY